VLQLSPLKNASQHPRSRPERSRATRSLSGAIKLIVLRQNAHDIKIDVNWSVASLAHRQTLHVRIRVGTMAMSNLNSSMPACRQGRLLRPREHVWSGGTPRNQTVANYRKGDVMTSPILFQVDLIDQTNCQGTRFGNTAAPRSAPIPLTFPGSFIQCST
jgi:hypothetical protein